MIGFIKKKILDDVECKIERLNNRVVQLSTLIDLIEKECFKECSSIDKKYKTLSTRMTTLTRHNNSLSSKLKKGEKALEKVIRLEKLIDEYTKRFNLSIEGPSEQIDSILNTKKK